MGIISRQCNGKIWSMLPFWILQNQVVLWITSSRKTSLMLHNHEIQCFCSVWNLQRPNWFSNLSWCQIRINYKNMTNCFIFFCYDYFGICYNRFLCISDMLKSVFKLLKEWNKLLCIQFVKLIIGCMA